MVTTLRRIFFFLILSIGFSGAIVPAHAEIVEGEVTAILNDELRVKLKLSVAPKKGDAVTIIWLLDGEELEAGRGEVGEVNDSYIVVNVTEGNANGMMGMTARIELRAGTKKIPKQARKTPKKKESAVEKKEPVEMPSTAKDKAPSSPSYFMDKAMAVAWTKRSVQGMDWNWYDAQSRCDFLDHAGFQDWRLPTMAELTHLYSTGAISSGKIDLGGCCAWSSEFRGVKETSFSKLLFGAPTKKHFGSVFNFQTGGAVEKDLDQTVPEGKHDGLRALCVRGMEK